VYYEVLNMFIHHKVAKYDNNTNGTVNRKKNYYENAMSVSV